MKTSIFLILFGIIPFVSFSQGDNQLLDKAEALLKSGKNQNDILTDTSFMRIHSLMAFRSLMQKYSTSGKLSICSIYEPGQLITVKGIIKLTNGTPAGNALVYVYQTNDIGWYSDTSVHIKMMEGDRKHARLFGYLRTSADGSFELNTIKPHGYPEGVLPGHIHFELLATNNEILITELLFDDDSRLTESNRAWAKREGFIIAKNNSKNAPVYEYELITH